MSDLDQSINQLLKAMFERKPANTRLTTAVCLSILQKKLSEKFSNVDWSSKSDFVTTLINNLEAAAAPKPEAEKKKAPAASDSDDDDDDDSDDDDDDSSDDEDEEEEDDADDDDESADEEEESMATESSESEGEEGENGNDERASKKQRVEPEAASVSSDSASERCTRMVWFLRKVHIPVPHGGSPAEGQTWEQYLTDVLIPRYKEKELDPERDDNRDAVKRYRIRQELKVLQAEADINLDPKARRGRGFVAGDQAASAPVFKPRFVDDD